MKKVWAFELKDGRRFTSFSSWKIGKQCGSSIVVKCVAFVPRDMKAEAVLRACENLFAFWVENGADPMPDEKEPWGSFAEAFLAYKASKKRKPKK